MPGQKTVCAGSARGRVGVNARRKCVWARRAQAERTSTAAAVQRRTRAEATPEAKQRDVTQVLHGACTGSARGEIGAVRDTEEENNSTAQKHAATRKNAERRGSSRSTHGSCRSTRWKGASREGRERGVRGCTGPRGGREGAQHESAQTAEGTQKARGKRAARAGTHQRGRGARGGDV